MLAVVALFNLWGVLVDYINPGSSGATDRKDVVQVFALIIAGIVATTTAAVGLVNLYFSRRNSEHNQATLQQQRDLDARRAQDEALQAYFEQIGALLTEHNLADADGDSILRQLARAETVTVLRRLDASRKRDLVVFLQDTRLSRFGFDGEEAVIGLGGADLSGADLTRIDLTYADLRSANLRCAYLQGAFLPHAQLHAADLSGADLTKAKVTVDQLEFCLSLSGATMRDGQKYENWIKTAKKKIPRSLD